MALTQTQRNTILAIIEVFETGKFNKSASAYSTIANLKGDTGGLSYGKHQASINSGNFYLLIKDYTELSGTYSKDFIPYLERLAKKDKSLANNTVFIALLKKAGTDRVMQQAQDDYFIRVFMAPAIKVGEGSKFQYALSYAVIYDSFIHGSYTRIRDRVSAPSSNEKAWIREYVADRRNWLATHSNTLLRKTVYRMDTFNELLKTENWDLKLPFSVRGSKLTPELLQVNEEVTPSDIAKIEEDNVKTDDVQPLIRPNDPITARPEVKLVQTKLNEKFFLGLTVDGKYGTKSVEGVRLLQATYGLTVDGIVGSATWALLA